MCVFSQLAYLVVSSGDARGAGYAVLWYGSLACVLKNASRAAGLLSLNCPLYPHLSFCVRAVR